MIVPFRNIRFGNFRNGTKSEIEMGTMLEIIEIIRKIEIFFFHSVRPTIQEQGFSKTEMMILMSVYHKKAFRMTDLAKMTDVPASTFTGIIDRLVARNFLIRVNDPEDRRSVLLHGTEKMQDTLAQMHAMFDAKLAEILKPVPQELITQTIENLNSIYNIVKESRTGHAQNECENCKNLYKGGED